MSKFLLWIRRLLSGGTRKAFKIQHDRVKIRDTHPGLYHSMMTLSVMHVALAVNFWGSNPTFNPYGIPKNLIGVVFFVLGVSQFVFLNLFRDLRKVRLGLAVSLTFMFFWGLSNAQQFFAGKASLQLPILYVALAVLHIPLLVESPVNPYSRRDNDGPDP